MSDHLVGSSRTESGCATRQAEMRRRVHSAVRGLPAPQAEVLSLALIEGFDTEEIAATLACAPAVVERILDEAALTIVGRSTRGALSAAQPD